MKVRIEFETQWSQRKMAHMRIDVLRWLRGEGAIAPTMHVEGDAPVEPPKYLKLKCEPCGLFWYAETFTPCLECGIKRTVHKMEFVRIALPAGAVIGQAYPLEASKPRITMVESA